MSNAQHRSIVGLEHSSRGGVRRGQARVKVEQVVLCRRKVVALARACERDDGNAGGSGGVQFEQAPRAGEHVFGLKEYDHVRIEYVADELTEVTKIVGVCGGGGE